MKKTFVFLFAIAFSLVSRAQDVNFEQYFLNEGLLSNRILVAPRSI